MNSIYIDYKVLLRALARAVQLMKKFDLVFLGPEAPYLWAEVRKQRYKSLLVPSSVGYILLPYMRLPTEVLMKIHRESATNN